MKRLLITLSFFNTLYSMQKKDKDTVIDIDTIINYEKKSSEDSSDLFLKILTDKKDRISTSENEVYKLAIQDFFRSNDQKIVNLVLPYLKSEVDTERKSPVNVFTHLKNPKEDIKPILHDLITAAIAKSFRSQTTLSQSRKQEAEESTRKMKYALITAAFTTLTTLVSAGLAIWQGMESNTPGAQNITMS